MTYRICCCIPFCRRTRKPWEGMNETSEWICGKHWPLVSKTLRRRDSLFLRRYKKRFGTNSFWCYPAGSPDRIEAARLARLCEMSWERCKKQAIERAAGI